MIGRGGRAEGTAKSQGSTGRKGRRSAGDQSPPFGWEPLQKYNPYRDTYRRHRKLFLGIPLAAMLVAVWFVAGAPKQYESTTALWFDNPPPQTSSITQGTDLTGVTQPPAAQAQVVLNELLTTRDFRIEVGKNGPLQSYLATHTNAGWGPTGLIADLKGAGSLSDRVVKALGPSSVTTRVAGPQVLAVAVHSTSPTVAAGTLKAIIAQYRLESDRVQTEQSKASLQYYRAQKVGAQADLTAATKRFTEYVDANPGAVQCTATQSAANSATCDVELKTLSDARKAASVQVLTATQQYNQAATSLSSLHSGTAKPLVIDPARVPTAPIKGPKNIVLAAVAGLFAGFLISLLAVILITGAELRAAAEVRARRLDDEREAARNQVASRGATAPALLAAAGPEPPLELVDFPPPPPAPPQVDPPARPRAVAPAPAPPPRPVAVPPPVVEPARPAEPPAAEVETPAVEHVPVEAPPAAAAPPPPARAETPPPAVEPEAEEAPALVAVEPPAVQKRAVTERRRTPRAPKPAAEAPVAAEVATPVVEPPAAEQKPAVTERRRAPRAPKQEAPKQEAPKQEAPAAEVPAAIVEPVAVEPSAVEPAVKSERRRAPRAPKKDVPAAAAEPVVVAEVADPVVEPVPVQVTPIAEVESAAEKKAAAARERRRAPRTPKQEAPPAAELAATAVEAVAAEVPAAAEVESAAEKKAAAARERRRAPRPPKKETPPADETVVSAEAPVPAPVPVDEPAIAAVETAAEKKAAAARERRRNPRPPRTPEALPAEVAAATTENGVVPHEAGAVLRAEVLEQDHDSPADVPGAASENGATRNLASAAQAGAVGEDARFSGTVIAVRNDGTGRAHRPIWTVRQVAGASEPPVGGLVHLAADPGHDGTVLAVHDAGNGLATYEVEIPEVRPSRSKTAEPGVPPLDPRWVGSEVTFAAGPSASARRREERRAVESRKGQSGEQRPSELPGKIPSVS